MTSTISDAQRLISDEESTVDPSTSPRSFLHEPRRTLTAPALAFLFFFSVSGGPIGSEGLISLLGPCIGLSCILLFPFIYQVPVGLATAELSTAFAQSGGYIHWVDAAFGRRAAFLNGYTSYLSGVTDSALYPVMFCNYYVSAFGDPGNAGQWFIKIGFILIWVLVVFAGKHLVGNTTLLIGCLILLPFIVFVCLGIPQVEPHRWLAGPPNDATFADFCAFCSLLYWNFSGADQISTFASEVKNPKKTYPRSVIAGVTLVGVTYLLPLGTAAGLLDGLDKTNFTDGNFPMVGKVVGGNVLSVCMLASAWLGCCALFVTEVFEDAFLLLGMAEEHFVPAIFAYRHPTRDTPAVALFVGFVLLTCCASLNFTQIIAVDNVFNCMSVIMELLAAVRLRYSKPDLRRPYRVPLSNRMLSISMMLPITLSVATMCLSLFSDPTGSATILIVSLLVVGIAGNEIRVRWYPAVNDLSAI